MGRGDRPEGEVSDEKKAAPYVCPECRGTENYYGILRFPDQAAPTCPNHKTDTGEERLVELEPAQ